MHDLWLRQPDAAAQSASPRWRWLYRPTPVSYCHVRRAFLPAAGSPAVSRAKLGGLEGLGGRDIQKISPLVPLL